MCSHPGDYRWSSYGANAHGQPNKLVAPHDRYQALATNMPKRQANYRSLFNDHIDQKMLEEIRQSTQKGWALGNERFKDEIEKYLKRRTRPLQRGGDHRSIEFKHRRGKVK